MIRMLEPSYDRGLSSLVVKKFRKVEYQTFQAVANASKSDLSKFGGLSFSDAGWVKGQCEEIVRLDSSKPSAFSFMNCFGNKLEKKDLVSRPHVEAESGTAVNMALNEEAS